MKGHQWENIDLIHKEPIMEFVSSSDTMPLQKYKVFMMWSISLVFSKMQACTTELAMWI